MKKVSRRYQKGFTLVELLVVLIIIGIIVAIILPNTMKAIDQANRRNTAGTLRAITNACFLCYTETRDWTSCDALAKLASSGNNFLDSAVLIAKPWTSGSAVPSGYPQVIGSATTGYQANYTAVFPSWPQLK